MKIMKIVYGGIGSYHGLGVTGDCAPALKENINESSNENIETK
jgi:hypothetical protein